MIKDATKLLGNLNGDKNYLITLKPENLQQDINLILDFLVNKRKWTCVYVSSGKSYKSLKKNLEEKDYDLENFFFIDMIEKEPSKKIDNVLFLQSSSALTQIDIAITQIIQLTQNKGFVFIDTLDGLLINNNPNVAANFIRSIIAKGTKYNSKTIVLSSGGAEEKLINKISTFFDKVIKVE